MTDDLSLLVEQADVTRLLPRAGRGGRGFGRVSEGGRRLLRATLGSRLVPPPLLRQAEYNRAVVSRLEVLGPLLAEHLQEATALPQHPSWSLVARAEAWQLPHPVDSPLLLAGPLPEHGAGFDRHFYEVLYEAAFMTTVPGHPERTLRRQEAYLLLASLLREAESLLGEPTPESTWYSRSRQVPPIPSGEVVAKGAGKEREAAYLSPGMLHMLRAQARFNILLSTILEDIYLVRQEMVVALEEASIIRENRGATATRAARPGRARLHWEGTFPARQERFNRTVLQHLHMLCERVEKVEAAERRALRLSGWRIRRYLQALEARLAGTRTAFPVALGEQGGGVRYYENMEWMIARIHARLEARP